MAFFKASNGSTEPSQNKGNENGFCPFIGFADDPETALAYPSPSNFCYHSKPIAPVSLNHQRKVCLTLGYGFCPVYQNETQEPLPRELRGTLPSRHKPNTRIPFVILILVILAGWIVLSLLGIIRIPGLSFPHVARQATATFVEPTPHVVVFMPSPTATPVATTQPTATETEALATPFFPHAIETPFGDNPKLVIHQVQAGEGYIFLAERFGTTVEAIKALNYELPESLWVNTILVIPINTDSVDGLPKFSVREITTEGLTIEDYAQQMQLDAGLLKRYNALPDEYLLEMGELIIIPN